MKQKQKSSFLTIVLSLAIIIVSMSATAYAVTQIENKQAQLDEQQAKMGILAKEYGKLNSDYMSKEEELNKAIARIDKKDKRINELKNKVEYNRARKHELKDDVAYQKKVINAKNDEINKLKKEVETLKKASDTSTKKVAVKGGNATTDDVSTNIVKSTNEKTVKVKSEPVKETKKEEPNLKQEVTKADNGYQNWKKMTVQATGYSNVDDATGGGNITASGTQVGVGTIAVDTNVIPLGTKVYIPQFGRVFTALDTGGAVKGNIIDIFFTSGDEARQWGRRTIEIYVEP